MRHETQFYQSAEALGIQQWEWDGLVALIPKFESCGRLVNMRNGEPMDDHGCGTAACIGGWLATDTSRFPACYLMLERSPPLSPLFYPNEHDAAWHANSTQAAQAIRNFLQTGKPDWASVMAE